MAKGNPAGAMGSAVGNFAGGVGSGMNAAGSTFGSGGGGAGGGMGAYSKGMSPMAQQKSMYSQMQPQMQQNRQMMNPGTQMAQDNPFSQNNPFIGMSRSHAMNTGQEGGYNNFQQMMQPGFWENMKQMMGQNRGGSGMLPPQGGNQQILPPSQSYGNDMRAQYDQPMRAQAPGLQPQQEMQAQLPAYGGGGMGFMGPGQSIQGPGGQQYGGGSIMNYLNPQRAGQVRF